MNTYLYANVSPLVYTDPTGEVGVFGAAFGFGTEIALQLAINNGKFNCIDWSDVFISTAVGALAPGIFTTASKLKKLSKIIDRNPSNRIGALARQRFGDEFFNQAGVQGVKLSTKKIVNKVQDADGCGEECK